MYDAYYDLLSLMARRRETLTVYSCVFKKEALSSQLHLFKDPDFFTLVFWFVFLE